jgi:superfamily II DNA or RNA helicase
MSDRGEHLSSWEWNRRYNSPPDDLVKSFYVPAFARSCLYDRAVGFFSSALLTMLTPSINDFVFRGGRMRLITSPANLSDEDLEDMGKGESLRQHLEADLVAAATQPSGAPAFNDQLPLLTWMIGNSRLEVKIALRELPDSFSLFHEKIGVFEDKTGNFMTFSGSPNETRAAALRHSESFPLHRSWLNEDQLAYAAEERERFTSLWDGGIEGITLWSANEWIGNPMREQFGEQEPVEPEVFAKVAGIPRSVEGKVEVLPRNTLTLLPSLPKEPSLHDYQKEAVNAWLTSEPPGRGIFAMATGTGKTFTAIAAATQLAQRVEEVNRPLLVVVSVPLVDLVNQWRDAAAKFGWHPAVWYGKSSTADRRYARQALRNARSRKGRIAEMLITTADSLSPRTSDALKGRDHELQRLLGRHGGSMLFIGDELHSLGTPARLAALPQNATYRLGLSATPKRHGDEEGTEALVQYFGEPVISIDLKEAIYVHKSLVEYDYHPKIVELSPAELKDYKKYSVKIARAYAAGNKEAVDTFIRKRNRVTQHASGKLHALRVLMENGLASQRNQIIYVAEGLRPDSDTRQIKQVLNLLTEDFGMNVAPYTGETSTKDRELLQSQLSSGEIHGLVAMKCLDEGVDIPAARIGIIMASTQNPRQFVQRRGRLLRHDPEKPGKHAEIYDMIVLPPHAEDSSGTTTRLVGAEIGRAVELADAARNREVRLDLIDTAFEFGLDPEQFTWMKLNPEDEMEAWTI